MSLGVKTGTFEYLSSYQATFQYLDITLTLDHVYLDPAFGVGMRGIDNTELPARRSCGCDTFDNREEIVFRNRPTGVVLDDPPHLQHMDFTDMLFIGYVTTIGQSRQQNDHVFPVILSGKLPQDTGQMGTRVGAKNVPFIDIMGIGRRTANIIRCYQQMVIVLFYSNNWVFTVDAYIALGVA